MSNTQQYGKWEVVHPEDILLRGQVNFVQNLEAPDNDPCIIKTGNSSGNFLYEIEVAASMDHPNVINVVEYSLDEECPYMVAEYYKGGTLKDADYLQWTARERVTCYRQLCAAYAYIQKQGYSRFDGSLRNTVLKEDGRTPVLIDFERATEIKSSRDITQIYSGLGNLFWKLMTGKDYVQKSFEEQRINERIESLTDQLEDLQQQKANLLG